MNGNAQFDCAKLSEVRAIYIFIYSAIAAIILKSELCILFSSQLCTRFEYLLKNLDILFVSEYKFLKL